MDARDAEAAVRAYFQQILQANPAQAREGLDHALANIEQETADAARPLHSAMLAVRTAGATGAEVAQGWFGDQVCRLLSSSIVVDGERILDEVFEWLPDRCRSWRTAQHAVKLHFHTRSAVECARAGYARRAAAHWCAVIRLSPSVRIPRALVRFVRTQLSFNAALRNRRLRRFTRMLLQTLESHHVNACLTGSLAISAHAGRFVKWHDDIDIDLLMSSKVHLDQASALVTKLLPVRAIRTIDWIQPDDKPARVFKLMSKSGLPFELAQMTFLAVTHVTRIAMGRARIPVVDAEELRNTYAVFLYKGDLQKLKRRSSKCAILELDRVLGRLPTRMILADELDRVPLPILQHWTTRHDRYFSDVATASQ